MTEEEWLTGSDPEPLLRYMVGKASNRKARLFIVWCCRQCDLFSDLRFVAAINLAERLEEASTKERDAVEAGIWEAQDDDEEYANHYLVPFSVIDLLRDTYSIESAADSPYTLASCAQCFTRNDLSFDGLAEELFIEQTEAIRELFGNPFRPAVLNPRWLTSTVIGIAESIDRHAQYHNMPILADALEDAGCDNSDILTHCREDRFHARGCWVLDLLLGHG